MASARHVDRDLDRSGRRLRKPGSWFAMIAALLAVPGVLLIVAGDGWVDAVGLGLVALALVPAMVALGLFASALVAWWSARGKPFA